MRNHANGGQPLTRENPVPSLEKGRCNDYPEREYDAGETPVSETQSNFMTQS